MRSHGGEPGLFSDHVTIALSIFFASFFTAQTLWVRIQSSVRIKKSVSLCLFWLAWGGIFYSKGQFAFLEGGALVLMCFASAVWLVRSEVLFFLLFLFLSSAVGVGVWVPFLGETGTLILSVLCGMSLFFLQLPENNASEKIKSSHLFSFLRVVILSAYFFLVWRVATLSSLGSPFTECAFLFAGAGALGIVSYRSISMAQPFFYLSGALTSGALLWLALLTSYGYIYGSSWGGIALLGLTLFLILTPSVVICRADLISLPPVLLGWGAVVGGLTVSIGLHEMSLGQVWGILVGVSLLLGVSLLDHGKFFKKPSSIGAGVGGAALLLFFLFSVFRQFDLRLTQMKDERPIRITWESGNRYELLSRSHGEETWVEVRRNFHETLESLEHQKPLRRLALLGRTLHGDQKRVLLLGGSLFSGLSALLEVGVPEVYVVSESQALLKYSQWFITGPASKAGKTRVIQGVQSPLSFLRTTEQRFDGVVLGAVSPRRRDASYRYSIEFYQELKARLYSDGVMVQAFQIRDWGQETWGQVYRTLRSVFPPSEGYRIELWRMDLRPEIPLVGLLIQKDDPQKSRSRHYEKSDFFLGSPFALPSLFLADSNVLDRKFGGGPISTRASFKLPAQASWQWNQKKGLFGPEFFTEFLSELSAEDGPRYGGLLWTRAALKKRRRDSSWRRDREEAIRHLGFDPSLEYPGVFPQEK